MRLNSPLMRKGKSKTLTAKSEIKNPAEMQDFLIDYKMDGVLLFSHKLRETNLSY